MLAEAKPERNSKIDGLVLAIQAIILLFLVANGFLHSSNNPQSETLLYSGCVFFLVLVIWSFWSWKLVTKRWFDPYLLFFLSATLFNGGQAILEVFHLNKNGFLEDLVPGDLFSDDITLKTLYLVTIGLATFHFSALISAVLANRKELKKHDSAGSLLSRNAYRVGRVLLYISLLPTILTLRNALSASLAGGYASLFEQQGATGIGAAPALISRFIFPGAFLVIATAPKNTTVRIQALAFILLYTLANLLLGSRSSAIMPLLAMLWLWNAVVRPLPKVFLAGIAFSLLGIVIPLIAAVRNEQGVSLSLEFLQQTIADTENPLIASISEMGNSMRTVAWTMQLVPDVRPFASGMTYLVSFLVLIPNIFGEGRHPALTMSGYDIPDFWLVSEIEPAFFERGGSFGFSFIAEAYLNFGWAAPLVLGLIGLFYGKLVSRWVNDHDPVTMALIATFVSFFLFYARQSSELIIRPFFWYVLFPFLLIRSLSKRAT
jgi:oligosaccharide repeat unit polymerase